MKCFLDMDGVLVDFVRGASEYYNLKLLPYPYIEEWNFIQFSGMTESDFWLPLGREFWANLHWTPDGNNILSLIESHFDKKDICLSSIPCMNSESSTGKIDWINKNLPEYKNRYLLGPDKRFYTSINTVLIDDNERNINNCKGHGILVPRPWNYMYATNTLEYIKERLNDL